MESLVPEFEKIVASIAAFASAGLTAMLTIVAYLHLRRVSARRNQVTGASPVDATAWDSTHHVAS